MPRAALFLPVRETEAQEVSNPAPGLPLPPGKFFPANFQSPAALTVPSGSCSLSGLQPRCPVSFSCLTSVPPKAAAARKKIEIGPKYRWI